MHCPITNRRVEVVRDGAPLILVAVARLPEVRAILGRLKVKHTNRGEAASGVSGLAVVRLQKGADVARIQQALDEAE